MSGTYGVQFISFPDQEQQRDDFVAALLKAFPPSVRGEGLSLDKAYGGVYSTPATLTTVWVDYGDEVDADELCRKFSHLVRINAPHGDLANIDLADAFKDGVEYRTALWLTSIPDHAVFVPVRKYRKPTKEEGDAS